MADRLLAALDGIAALAWRTGVRFQWPCWLLAWAWDRQAAADLAFARQCGLMARVPHCPQCGSALYDGSSCPDCGHHPSHLSRQEER